MSIANQVTAYKMHAVVVKSLFPIYNIVKSTNNEIVSDLYYKNSMHILLSEALYSVGNYSVALDVIQLNSTRIDPEKEESRSLFARKLRVQASSLEHLDRLSEAESYWMQAIEKNISSWVDIGDLFLISTTFSL